MERFNGGIRDREKVMTGGFVRPREGLKGKTPGEVWGIKIEGDNKWIKSLSQK
jgi:hypothetical protein